MLSFSLIEVSNFCVCPCAVDKSLSILYGSLSDASATKEFCEGVVVNLSLFCCGCCCCFLLTCSLDTDACRLAGREVTDNSPSARKTHQNTTLSNWICSCSVMRSADVRFWPKSFYVPALDGQLQSVLCSFWRCMNLLTFLSC